MSSTGWVMPDWMKPLEPYFQDRGVLGVEANMNQYGAKCAARLVAANEGKAGPADADLHALLVNAQVGLLVALHAAGKLKT